MKNHEKHNNMKENQKKKNEDRDREDEIFNIGRGCIEEDDSIWDVDYKKKKKREKDSIEESQSQS